VANCNVECAKADFHWETAFKEQENKRGTLCVSVYCSPFQNAITITANKGKPQKEKQKRKNEVILSYTLPGKNRVKVSYKLKNSVISE
jgi:hypothetical protein